MHQAIGASEDHHWHQISRDDPDGGYCLLSVPQIAMAWWSYTSGSIGLYDLRAWFALAEIQERRSAAQNAARARGGSGPAPESRESPPPHEALRAAAKLQELHRLVGGRGGRRLSMALRRLESIGLADWSGCSPRLAQSPDQLKVDLAGFWPWLEQVRNRKRRVPMPRRIVRYLSGDCSKAIMATMLGHLLRCVYHRDGQVRADGAVKATWIAALFGLTDRSVRAARTKLIELGLISVRRDTPNWYARRFGMRSTVNLRWAKSLVTFRGFPSPEGEGEGEGARGDSPTRQAAERPSSQTRNDRAARTGFSAVSSVARTGTSGVCLNQTLSPKGRSKNQTPASGGPSGVSVQDRESGPTLQSIRTIDLEQTDRVLELFNQAVGEGRVVRSEHERLRFVSAAERSLAYGQDPAAFFAWLIPGRARPGRWDHLSQSDEDRGAARLKRHLYGAPRSRQGLGRFDRPEKVGPSLSAAGRFAKAMLETLAKIGYRGDPMPVVRRQKPGWSRQCWLSAVREWEDFRLASLVRG